LGRNRRIRIFPCGDISVYHPGGVLERFFVIEMILFTCSAGTVLWWVDIGTRTTVPLRFVTYLSKATKIDKIKCFDPVTASSLVTTFWVIHYICTEGSNVFFSQYGLYGHPMTHNFT
jgi:hypothetical protein